MGRNDFDRRSDGRSPMKGGMMNPNRGGYNVNRGGGGFSNRGGVQNRGGGQQNRGGSLRGGGMQQRGGPSGRGSQQNNRGGQQRPRGGSQSGNTITVNTNKNITPVKTEKTVTPQAVKEETKTPVKSDSQTNLASIKSEKTTPQSQKSAPQAQNFKSPPPRQQQSQQRSTPSPNTNMRTQNPQKPQTPTQAPSPRATSTPNQNSQEMKNQDNPQQNQGKPQQGRSQMQQNESKSGNQFNRSQRDFRNNRNDRSSSQNRRDRSENRYQDYRGNKEESMMEGQMNVPKEEKKFTMRCRLFIGNLTAETTEEEFKAMFEPFGELNEVYLNPQRGFGFCRLDYRSNAEAAKAAIDGTMRKGRTLRVRFASHGAALKVKNLSPFVSNELLESAFSQLGEVERAIVICDDRGKSTGEGVVEFARKQVALSAIKRINDGAFILTASPRPIFVEPLEQKDEEDGLAEKFIPKNDQYRKEREVEPHFAPPGSFEYSFASKWKQIVEMEKTQMEQVHRNVEEAKLKLEGEMENAQMEHQEEMIRKDLMRQQEELRRLQEIRQQSELRRRQEMEMRMRQQEDEERIRQEHQQRRQDMMMRRNDSMRHQMPGDALVQEDMMMGQGGIHDLPGGSNRGNAPPLPPPPAPPASMGLDRGRSQMSGGMGNNFGGQGGIGGPVGIGGDNSMGGPGAQMSPFDGPSGNNFGGAGNNFQPQGNMGGGIGVSGPGNMYNQGGGMGGNINSQGMRGNERGMDRRREGGPREDYVEMKRMRRF